MKFLFINCVLVTIRSKRIIYSALLILLKNRGEKEGARIKVFKEKQYIIFDFEDGKTVRYDLSTKQTIGKTGKQVQDLRTQLRGFTISDIINAFEDVNYRNFLRFVYKVDGRSITNVGSLIERAKTYSSFEQFFSAGIESIEANFNFKITDVPSGLLKICRNYQIQLTSNLLNCYKADPDFFNIAFELEYSGLTPKYIITVLSYGGFHHYRNNHEWQNTLIHNLHYDKNYNVKSLLLFLDYLYTYEALDDVFLIRDFYDYVNMVSKISPKYEKYPKNFLTSHKIAVRNYNRLKEQFAEEEFKNRYDKSLEYSYEDYRIIYPKTTQDIKDEAVQQNHCVASYIKDVINGRCHILFLRKKDELDKSLVTLEVRNNKVVQARGRFNRDLTTEELGIVNKYNEKLERTKIAC